MPVKISRSVLQVGRYIRAIRRRVSQWIAPPDPSDPSNFAFYRQVGNCQVRYLWHLYRLFLGERNHGFFVEVGANDGLHVSNTRGLACAGWNGWYIEPVPESFLACRANYREMPNIRVCQIAIGPRGTDTLEMTIAREYSTANPLVLEEMTHLSWAAGSISNTRIVVPSVTLDQFLEGETVPEDFDVLVVDVEGFESEVFDGFNLHRWRPKMIIIEISDVHPELERMRKTDASLGRQIGAVGYEVVHKDHINTIFVRDDVWERAYGYVDSGQC